MKTKKLICYLILAFLGLNQNYGYAQWTGGGDAVLTTTTLGTTTSFDLPIITNNSEHSRFIKTGEFGIGIGTTTPTSFLNVYTSGSTNDEEPFKTVVPSATETNWRMYRGGDQIMRITSPVSGDALFIQSPEGDMKLGTGHNGGIIPSFMIRGGNGSDIGNV